MALKVTHLTDEQKARFPEFVDKWKKIGLCTDPADRPAAEAARTAHPDAGGSADAMAELNIAIGEAREELK